MSPARFKQEPKMINGPRPAPLKIDKESHLINKPTKATSSFVAPQYVSKPPPPPPQQQQQQRTQPVIIYTHSPKVIHTQARDFMALVQKLTGLSRSNSTDHEESKQPSKSKAASAVKNEDNESSSVVTEENVRSRGGDHGGDDGGIGSAVVDHFKTEILNPPHNTSSRNNNNNPYLADIPLFTPTGTDFFCSPRPLYRYNESSSFASPGIGNLASPSLLEFLKGLPEY